MRSFSLLMNRGDYLAYAQPVGLTPTGVPVFDWTVQDLSTREVFASGCAVGDQVAVLEMATAARGRMAVAA